MPNPPDIDADRLVKVSSGVTMGAGVGQAGTAFLAAKTARSALGYTSSALGVVGTGAGIVGDYFGSEQEKQKIAEFLGISVAELEGRRAQDSALLREVVENSDNAKWHIAPKAGVVAIGTALGNFIPIPIAGMLIGGITTNYLYDLALMGANEEVSQMIGQISAQHEQEDKNGRPRTPVSGTQIFAIMAANAPKEIKSLIKQDLERRAGTALFSEALQTKKGQAVLAQLASEYNTSMGNSKSAFQMADGIPISDQIAEEINRGDMKIADLLMTERFLAAARKHNDKLFMEAYQIDPIALSGFEMADNGVSIDQSSVLPGHVTGISPLGRRKR